MWLVPDFAARDKKKESQKSMIFRILLRICFRIVWSH